MRLFITGVCGFVGSCLARGIIESMPDVRVKGIDNFIREGSRRNIEPLQQLGVTVLEGDIRNEADLDSAGPADWVLDCAAEPSVLAGVGGSTTSFGVMDHNLVGTLRILEFCKKHGAGLVLMSTSRVYSIKPLAALPVRVVDDAYRPDPRAMDGIRGLSELGISESFPTDPPLSLYGVSKRCSELAALEYADAYGFPVWINRCGVLAGAGQFGKADQGIFSYWIRSWRDRLPLTYIGFDGAGSQVRDCLHPRDLVPALVRQFAESTPTADAAGYHTGAIDPRICNFAGGHEHACSLANLSDWCRGRFGPHVVGSRPEPRPFDLPWVVLDSARAHARWGWKPVTPLPVIFEEIARS
ncbi:MAG: NAD-dependent epimerase/dehydratase family protein [Planctomycetia bacterium]|nr:NAD-dependent epimerase/dehydratase family protein [Planctomycetia bacterium]